MQRMGENKNCNFCNKEFYAPRSLLKKGGGKYCSHKCYSQDKKNGEYKKCLVCNKEFYTTPCQTKVGWGKYCSKQCRLPVSDEVKEKIAAGHRGEKSHLWKGGRKEINKTRIDNYKWKATRKEVYKRDNWKCQKCGKQCFKGNIACHHIVPWRITQDDSMDNLQTVCTSCHTKLDFNIINNEQRMCAFTIVDDRYYYAVGTPIFINSFKKFHPDDNIDLIVFRQDMVDKVFAKEGINFYQSKPYFGEIVANLGYKVVCNIDADTVITGRLTEVFDNVDYDIAGAWNYNDYENASFENITAEMYIQAGMVASTSRLFWKKWKEINKSAMQYIRKENDTLNLLAYNDEEISKLKLKLLDKDKNYYGCKSLGRESEFYIKDDKLMCRKEEVRAYHHARGGVFPKLDFDNMPFTQEVKDWLKYKSFYGQSVLIKGI